MSSILEDFSKKKWAGFDQWFGVNGNKPDNLTFYNMVSRPTLKLLKVKENMKESKF